MTVVAFDGDDTLWHNEPLFWASTDAFAEMLSPWTSGDDLAERLAQREIANLALFGYGIKGFALSMIETAIQVTDGQVPAQTIGAMIERAKDMLAHPVHLLDGAEDALWRARESGAKVWLITKGDLFDQEGKLARSGLAALFDQVHIVSEKDAATYGRLLAAGGVRPQDFTMVGNSVRSDILPVLELGGQAVHVPYPNRWIHERADLPESHPGLTVIASLRDLT